MAFEPFWDETFVDEIAEVTNGSLVEYRGQKFWMHCEQPTQEVMSNFQVDVRGIANILIGARSRFPTTVERGELISVDGDDWIVADYLFSEDGEDIFVALSRTTRTDGI